MMAVSESRYLYKQQSIDIKRTPWIHQKNNPGVSKGSLPDIVNPA
jgi:hypothetical protein